MKYNDGFLYTVDQFNALSELFLKEAKNFGADQAQVYIAEDISQGVEVRNQNIEHCATNQEFNLSLTVMLDKKTGVVSTNNIGSDEDVKKIVKQAIDIAKYTQPDQDSGLLEPEYLASSIDLDLGLYHYNKPSIDDLVDTVKDLEKLSLDSKIKNIQSNGSSINLSFGQFFLANTNNFNLGYKSSKCFKSVSIIGSNDKGMQTDYWVTKHRDYQDLITNLELADIVKKRVTRRLNSGAIIPGSMACIFEHQIAKEILYSAFDALSGMSQYHKLSFLQDSLGKSILPSWCNINEDPLLYKGAGSRYFDNEGFAVKQRPLITSGVVETYLLSAYSARKLKMCPTGHASGLANIIVESNFEGGIEEMAKTLSKGFIVVENIGNGLNSVTGDYSVGASGLYVEQGEIKYFLDGITISGNIKDILANITYIGDDVIEGSMKCGSLMVPEGIISINKS